MSWQNSMEHRLVQALMRVVSVLLLLQ